MWPRLLERLSAGDPLFSSEEVRRWHRSDFRHVVHLGILREAETASHVLCDSCDEGHFSEVVWVAGGRRACIACPQEGTVTVATDRLRQWRFDTNRFAELLAQALELTGPVQSMDLGCLWHLGRRRLAGRFRDIFLAVADPISAGCVIEKVLKYGGLISGVVLLPRLDYLGTVPPQIALVDLAALTHIVAGPIAVDFDYLEGVFAAAADAPRQHACSVTAPAGASWKDVAMVVSEGLLHITIRSKQFERAPAEAGFGEPDQRLELLRFFAAARGTVAVDKMNAFLTGDSPAKMRGLRLRQLLQAFIEVDGDPIEHNRKAGTYSCQFEIRLSGDEGFRTPAGATWLDFTFQERADGRIAVSVSEKQRFRAYGANNQSGRSLGEVAEDGHAITRIHSLEEMGLRSDLGQLTPEGTVFVKLLRAGGTLRSAGNEMVVLKLAGRLREWVGLPGEPIQLAKASGRWTAVFACATAAGNA